MKKSTFFAGFTAIMATVVFTGVFYTAEALQGADPVRETSPGATVTDYRPGATNPVKNPGRLYLFRDDWLCTLFGNLGEHTLTKNWNYPSTSGDLTAWHNHESKVLSESDYGNGLNKNVISPTALAMGRINSPANDDVVGAFYYIEEKNGEKYVKPYVFFVDSPTVNTKGKFPDWMFEDDNPDNYYSIDIAVGDVDRIANAEGEFNDEIVVAFRKTNYDGHLLTVAVLDKDLKLKSHGSAVGSLDYPKSANEYTRPHFSVTMGDYDNDGACEIAVGFRTSDSDGGNQKYEIDIWDYTDKLIWMHHYTDGLDVSGNDQYNVVDLTSGDFNGDGIDEIAVSISSFQNTDAYDMRNLVPYLWIFTTDKDLLLTKSGRWHRPGDESGWWGSVRGAGITSGLFKYDPTGGFSTARRQIAMACIPHFVGPSHYSVNVLTFDVDDDFHPTLADYYIYHQASEQISYSQDNTCIPKITAGNFKGLDEKTLREQMAVSWADNKHPKFAVFDLDERLYLSLKYHGDFHPDQPGTSDQEFMSVPFMAADKAGLGFYLGAPVHLEVPHCLRANYVVQEPPQHIDYLPDDNENWKIVRVSRNKNFFASFQDEEEKTFTTTHQDNTNFDVGGSVEISAKQTFDASFFIVEDQLTTKEQGKVSYDYDSVTEKLNGKYEQVVTKAQHNTASDDYIQAQYKVMDVWRFRIYGPETKGKKNGFYEVVMPGPIKTIVDLYGFDFSDYYQPIHENGNILSYPMISDKNFPEDKGSFKVCDTEGKNCQDISDAMTDEPEQICCSGGSSIIAVNWTKESWSTLEKVHSHSWNSNFDFSIANSAKATTTASRDKWYQKLDVSFHIGKSWSTTDFSKNTMSSSKGVTIVLPSAGDSDQNYQFKPVVYSTKDGTLKLAHAVNPTYSDQAIWWQNHYQTEPDLSLNLPKKFHFVSSGTDPNYLGVWYVAKTRQSRSRMRRLFLLHNEPKSKDTDKLFVATSPTAGDTIYVLTTVYNYSHEPATGFHVRFNYAEFNPDLKDGNPGFDADSSINLIEDKWVDGLGPLDHRDVYVKWDINEHLGGETPDTAKSYVIYVTVDPNNNVPDETHELYVKDQYPAPGPCPTQDGDSAVCGIFCGSNNQGYWPWDNSFMIFSPKQDDVPGQDETVSDISIEPESLEVETTPESEGYGDYLFTHAPYRLKLKIVASEADKNYREVFFHDNDRIFSVKRSLGLNPGENDFYCEWTPTEPGDHTLKVVVFEDRDDSEKQDNIVTLDVNVLDSQRPNHR